MHRRIVEAITEALTKRSDENKENLLRIFVQRKETDGFWQMCIVPDENFKYLIPHIEDIGVAIGRYYGEGLSVEKTKEHIIFS